MKKINIKKNDSNKILKIWEVLSTTKLLFNK